MEILREKFYYEHAVPPYGLIKFESTGRKLTESETKQLEPKYIAQLLDAPPSPPWKPFVVAIGHLGPLPKSRVIGFHAARTG